MVISIHDILFFSSKLWASTWCEAPVDAS